MPFFTSEKGKEVLEKNEDVLEAEAKLLKALAHPVRLVIVKGLMAEEGCNVSEMQECLNIPQSTLSQHLAKLREANILNSKRNGLERNYYVVNKTIRKIVNVLSDFEKNR
ncbi:ArsR family transcriptional regulator [Halanaerobium saccharolyticum]|uniref:ArsR family transcriptional regulator n=1 Tax=Halanaerobium saccharolyticum TaxID=43595 RepID=A0A4R7YVL6_9FIRM|nr:metalloregulator ArsR/SmtB family transcription factor [Halanaerobium saccharolyticum]RAK07123.1 ArsR family transcriptional regulator [Halanaerobium saccharolyticum]TDW01865.1 ArsR family transcriptional regulator [Halanaerobium saccharolyticum]TDX53111.1 ArsR family transcriptional regulator [Halanaerobium saccharolyticum]